MPEVKCWICGRTPKEVAEETNFSEKYIRENWLIPDFKKIDYAYKGTTKSDDTYAQMESLEKQLSFCHMCFIIAKACPWSSVKTIKV